MLTNKQRRTLAFSILIAASLYLFFIYNTDSQKIFSAINNLSLLDGLIILTCSALNYGLRFIRWQYYIKAFGHIIPTKQHLYYYLAGLALTTTPAKAGETLRSVFLLPHKVKLSQSFACFFSERLLDVVVMTLFASLIFITFPAIETRYAIYIIGFLIFISLLLPLLSTSLPQQFLTLLMAKIPSARTTKIITSLLALLCSIKQLFRVKLLYRGLLIGFIAWFIQGLAFYFIMQKLGFPLALEMALTIYAVSILAGAASFIPGGIGATEAVMGLMLLTIGSEPHIAVAAPILTRLASLWFAVTIGLIANMILSFNKITP